MPTDREIRVIIVEDDPFVRTALRRLMEDAPGMLLVGEAENGLQARTLIHAHGVDVVLSDLQMPEMTGIELIQVLSRTAGAPPVVVLSNHAGQDAVVDALRAGAIGYIDKNADPGVVIDAIRRAADGDSLLSPSVTRHVIGKLRAGPSSSAPSAAWEETLTAREVQIARAVADGLSNESIGDRLSVTLSTVKTNVSRILTKLHLTNRVQIAMTVHGIASPESLPDERP